MMSPDDVGNFMTRWRMDATTRNRLSEGQPIKFLYDMFAFITRYWISIIFIRSPSPKVICILI